MKTILFSTTDTGFHIKTNTAVV